MPGWALIIGPRAHSILRNFNLFQTKFVLTLPVFRLQHRNMKRDTQTKITPVQKILLPKDILESDLIRPKHFYETKEGKAFFNRKEPKDMSQADRDKDFEVHRKLNDAFDARPDVKLVQEFEMWYTNVMGWCIPTLLIRNASARQRMNAYSKGMASSDRTYAISLDGKPCRIGMGPHVLRQIHVYVTQAREAALRPYLELLGKGEITSNEIRDRISTRRAQGSERRRNSFLW